MKKKSIQLEKKLTVKKLVVAELNNTQQEGMQGGARTNTITPSCQYTFCFCYTYGTRCC